MPTPCAGCCDDPECSCVKACDENGCHRHEREAAAEFQREYLSGSDLRTAGLRLDVAAVFEACERECREVGEP